jgi:citrate synthase
MTTTPRPKTDLCRFTSDSIFVRSADLVEELMGQVSFTEMILFHLTGRRPSAGETKVVDAVLVSLMEHGLTPSAIATRLVAHSSPEALQAAVAAGLLAVGSQFVGTTEDAAKLLEEIAVAPGGMAQAASAIAQRHRAERRAMPGFGHHLHKPDDPRTPRLLDIARKEGVAGRHVEALQALAAAVDKAAGRHVTVNLTGAVAAVLTDLGLPSRCLRGIALISRAAGLVGHVKEEQESPSARFIWELVEDNVEHGTHLDAPD